MTYPLFILKDIIPNMGISIAFAAAMTSIIVYPDSVQIDDGYDEKKDDLIWVDASNKRYDSKFFLDLIFYPENEIYDL